MDWGTGQAQRDKLGFHQGQEGWSQARACLRGSGEGLGSSFRLQGDAKTSEAGGLRGSAWC